MNTGNADQLNQSIAALVAITGVKTTVDSLAAEFITLAEFNRLEAGVKGQVGFDAGKRYQISDSAANIAGLLNATVDRTIAALVPNNGAKLQLNAAQHGSLIAANITSGYKLFSGFIDLSDTLANLKALSPSALKAASSWEITDPKANAG